MSKYCIIGTGRQGTAALYDIIKYAEAEQILLLDSNQGIDLLEKKINKKLTSNLS